jgi:hypothetical protein
VKPHGRGEPCVWAEELRGWRRSLQDAPRGGKELETVEGRGSAPMRAGPRRIFKQEMSMSIHSKKGQSARDLNRNKEEKNTCGRR